MPTKLWCCKRKKYARHEVYEVRPEAQMAARFALNGLVCEIRLEPAHFRKDEVDLRFGIDAIDSLLDEIVPPSERGKEDQTHPSHDLGEGQIFEQVRSYSNVRVHIISSHDTTVAYVVGSIASAKSVDKWPSHSSTSKRAKNKRMLLLSPYSDSCE